jgi:transposase-like protein
VFYGTGGESWRDKFTREFKLEAARLIRDRGVSYAQAAQDLKVHPTQLRNWVKAFANDPQHAFPGQGQMKPEQLEIARLKREVIKLKAERDILKKFGADGRRIRAMVKAMPNEDDICLRARLQPFEYIIFHIV